MPYSLSNRRRALLFGIDTSRGAIKRIQRALSLLAGVIVFGTVGYVVLGFGWLEAAYQTVTTVATVGFREVRPLSSAGMVFTIVLILMGVGTVLYNLGVIVEAVVEGHLIEHLWRRRMDRNIALMRDHVVILGFGRVGRAAAERLLDEGHEIVLVDRDPVRLEGVAVPHVLGDGSADDTLREAGIMAARALICSLDTDEATVYATLSARALRPDLVIISRARTVDSKVKLVQAGATRAVNPQLSGGRRMASFALHADVAEFLDEVMNDDEIAYSIEQVRLPDGTPLAGQTIATSDLVRLTGAQLLAVRLPRKGPFVPIPPGSTVLDAGMTLIVFGDPDQVAALRALAATGHTDRSGHPGIR